MAKFYEQLPEKLSAFIREQMIFFVATAPASGRINLSPKGMNTFRVLDPRTVAYLDLTGSGNETSAHLEENGRLTIMFCSFGNEPLILRLYGTGRVVRPVDPEWPQLLVNFEPLAGMRQIILMAVESLQTSCGFAVPTAPEMLERNVLVEWAERKGEAGMAEYRQQKNVLSIDGIPTGLQ